MREYSIRKLNKRCDSVYGELDHMPISLRDVSGDVCTMREQHWRKNEHPLPYISLFNRDTYSVKRKITLTCFYWNVSTGIYYWLTSSTLILLRNTVQSKNCKGVKLLLAWNCCQWLKWLSVHIIVPFSQLNYYILHFYSSFSKQYRSFKFLNVLSCTPAPIGILWFDVNTLGQ